MARHDAMEGSSTVTVYVCRVESARSLRDMEDDENRSTGIARRPAFSDQDGGFWAEMPEYPGCYTQAETMDELKENVREAVQCYVEAGYANRHVTARTEAPEILQAAL